MKSPNSLNPSLGGLLALAATMLLAGNASAADIIKADTTDTLDQTAAWVGGAVPTAGDRAVWDSTLAANNSWLLGANASWLGLAISNPAAGPVTIGAGNSLTLGAAGVDMAGATTNLILNNNVVLGVSQIWNVAAGVGVTNAGTGTSGVGGVSGAATLVKLGGGSLAFNVSSNTYTGGTIIGGGSVYIGSVANGHAGTGAVTLTNNGKIVMFSGENAVDPGGAGGSFSNAFVVPAGETGTIWGSWRMTGAAALGGPLTGGGTLNFRVNGIRCEIAGNWSAFTGQINVTTNPTYTANPGAFRIQGTANLANHPGFQRLNLGDNVNLESAINPPNGGATASTTIVPIGELTGTAASFVGGNPTGGRFVAWKVGGLNTSTTYPGTIRNGTGAARLIKEGTGTFTITGANTYTGGTIISNGVLQVGNGGGSGTIGNGTCSNFAALVFNRSGVLTNSAGIHGSGPLVVSNGVALTLSGVNTYAGKTTVAGGSAVRIVAQSGLGANPAAPTVDQLTLDNGGLLASTTFSLNDANRGITLAAGGGSFAAENNSTLTLPNTITGPGSLTISGAGGSVVLGTANSFAGKTFINSGTLVIAAQNYLGLDPVALTSDQLTLNGGELRTTASLSLNGNRGITLGVSGGTLSPDTSTSLSVANAVTGAGGLTVNGAGVVTLAYVGNNGYGGPTTINQGSLVIGAGGSIANTTAITVAGGATLDVAASGIALVSGQSLTGNGTVAGNVSAPAGSQISPGASIGRLTINGNLTLSGTSGQFEMNSSTNDNIQVNGNLVLTGTSTLNVSLLTALPAGTYTLIRYTGSLSGNAANLTLTGYSGARSTAALSTATPGQVNLIVTGNPGILRWVGDGVANNWDINGTANWFNTGTSLTDKFFDGDITTFTDTGSTAPNVNLATTVSPSTAVFGSTVNYTVSSAGAGKLGGGGSLVKTNSGTLTLLTVNTYSGGTTVGAGSTVQLGNGATVGTLGVGNIVNNGSINYNEPVAVTNGSAISGSGSLAQQGAGTVALSGNNSYSGQTTISGSTILQVGGGAAAGSLGTGTVQNDGMLVFNRTGTLTNSGVIAGSGSLSVSNSGRIALAANNSWSGATVIDTGTLQVGVAGTSGSLGTIGNVTLANNGKLAFNRGDSITNSIIVEGAGVLLKEGAGDLTLVSANTYVGSTVISSGVLRLGDGTTDGTLGTGVITNNGVLEFDNVNLTTVSSAIHGTGAIRQHGPGNLVLAPTADSTFSGGGYITNSTVSMGVDGGNGPASLISDRSGLGTGTVTLYDSSVILSLGNSATDTGINAIPGFPTTLNVPAGRTGTFWGNFRYVFTGGLTGSGTFNLRVNGTRGDIAGNWSGFSGDLIVSARTGMQDFRVNNTAGLPNARLHLTTDANGIVSMQSQSAGNPLYPIGELSGDEGTQIIATAGAGGSASTRFVVGGLNTSTNFAGNTYDNGAAATVQVSLIKVGSGAWTLNGTNLTHAGSTVVSNGTLVLSGIPATPSVPLPNSTNITVVAGATLNVAAQDSSKLIVGSTSVQTLMGGGNIIGNVEIAGSGTLAPGQSIGTLTISGAANLSGTTVMEIDRAATPKADKLVATSIVGGGTLNVVNIGSTNLQPGDTFVLFSSGVSGFTAVNLPALPCGGLSWNNTIAANGSISVVGTACPTAGPVITNSFSGNVITISWPVSNLGWHLETNAIAVTNTAGWFAYPGTTLVTSTNITVNPAQKSVFFRLAP